MTTDSQRWLMKALSGIKVAHLLGGAHWLEVAEVLVDEALLVEGYAAQGPGTVVSTSEIVLFFMDK